MVVLDAIAVKSRDLGRLEKMFRTALNPEAAGLTNL
jgi:hypothetical protein